MIYNIIDPKLIKLGKPKKFSNEDKWITPIYYNGGDFDFSLKNKYIKIEGIKSSIYGRDYITIKSKEYSEKVDIIADKLETISPIQGDGTFRVFINDKTKISDELEKLRQTTFDACISLLFPTIYEDENKKKTLQIYAKDIVVIKILNNDLEIDFDNLKLAA